VRRLLSLAIVLAAVAAPRASVASKGRGIWIAPERLASLPTTGPAWEALRRAAETPTPHPDLSNQEDATNVHVLAKALVAARTGDARLREEVVRACGAAIGSEGGRTLALGRELAAYAIAADLVGLPPEADARFRSWLDAVRRRQLGGFTLISTHDARPNNWGTHAGASRIAAALYLGDTEEVERAARVFRGWLGERDRYAGFRYGDLAWQADPALPVGVNPLGALRAGRSIDGVLPDDQRRAGGFHWPPPHENYVYEALQGALAQAVMLTGAGYTPFEWGDRALLRAFRWLHDEARYPAAGDDTWESHVVNFYYGTAFPAPVPSQPGKNVGFTDWTHAAALPLDGRVAGARGPRD
jgi:hypothetical protein